MQIVQHQHQRALPTQLGQAFGHRVERTKALTRRVPRRIVFQRAAIRTEQQASGLVSIGAERAQRRLDRAQANDRPKALLKNQEGWGACYR